MHALRVQLFGGFHAWQGETPLDFYSQKTQLLLAYLMLHGQQAHSRTSLISLFWSDFEESRAQANLRNALYSLRKSLSGLSVQSEGCIITEGTSVRFNINVPHSLDVHEFNRLLDAARNAGGEERARFLEQAVSHYQGDLLKGAYDDWVLIDQDHYRSAYCQVLKELIAYCQEGKEYERAISWARKAVEINALQEDVHQALMRCYALQRDRTAALRQYAECAAIFKRDLNIQLGPESISLYHKILEGKPLTEVPPTASPQIQHNLPRQSTSFLGRKQQLAEIKQFLTASRLVTLVGVGGCGKTRLALQVATDLLADYPDGVWFLDLSVLNASEQIPKAIAEVFGVREARGQPLWSGLINHLRSRHLLLLLDNCEHLIPGCAQLTEKLLHACPNLRVLATSREMLEIPAEMVYKTPTLLVPDPGSLQEAGEELVPAIKGYEAIELFCVRAASILPDFSLDRQNVKPIIRICQQLDGIPLAIELAAAQLKSHKIEEIVGYLAESPGLLIQGTEAVISKHQTLQATLDWSYRLLTEKEQALFKRLSVFVGGFILWAIESVCSDNVRDAERVLSSSAIEEFEMQDLLTQLVNKSLVVAESRSGKVRYRLLEVVRQFSLAKLEQTSEEIRIVRQRHLKLWLQLAERAAADFTVGANQQLWLDRLDQEHHNLQSALTWAFENEPEMALRLAAAMWQFWDMKGYWEGGLTLLERALAQRGDVTIRSRAKALYNAGFLAVRLAKNEQAKSLLEENLALCRQMNEKRAIANALNALANIAYEQHDYTKSRTLAEEGLSILRELQDERGISMSLNNIGLAAAGQSDHATANRFFEEVLSRGRERKDIQVINTALSNLAMVAADLAEKASQQGDLTSAKKYYAEAQRYGEESVALARSIGNPYTESVALINLAIAAYETGDYANAERFSKESLIIRQKLNDNRGILRVLVVFVKLAHSRKEIQRAARLLGAVEASCEVLGIPHTQYLEEEEYECTLTTIHQQLGEETFTAAWTEGRAMTLEQVIAYALRQE